MDFADGMPIPLFFGETFSNVIEDMVHLINSLQPGANVAVITSDEISSKVWHDRLVNASKHISREVQLSGEENLTRRLPVHITTAAQTKGLQFNAVLIPDLGSFSSLERHLYIAMTRAKDALYLATKAGSELNNSLKQLLAIGAISAEKTRPKVAELQ